MTSQGPTRAFTLIEVAVSVAVVAILAGTITPLAMRSINQRRIAVTRKNLKLAFESMFGARDRRVANMRSDFGFNPDKTMKTLPVLVSNVWGKVPPFGENGNATFKWGYNGPYWYGPVVGGNPVDAWDSPIELIVDSNKTWQLRSLGPKKEVGNGALHYPEVPAAQQSYLSEIIIDLVPIREDKRFGGNISIRYGGNENEKLSSITQTIKNTGGIQSFHFTVPSGMVELIVKPTTKEFWPETRILNLLPGEHYNEKIKIN